MPTNPQTVPIDEAEREDEWNRTRQAQIARAQAEIARQEAIAHKLESGQAVAWSPTAVVLGVLGASTTPMAFVLYAWSFRWLLPFEPVLQLITAALVLTAGIVAGITEFPAVRDVRLTIPARLTFTAISGLLLASNPLPPFGDRVWLAMIGVTAAACVLTLPRYAIALIAHRRADRHRRRADKAREDVAYFGADSRGAPPMGAFERPTSGTLSA